MSNSSPLVARFQGVQVGANSSKVIGLLKPGTHQCLKPTRVVATFPAAASGNAMVKGQLVRTSTQGTDAGAAAVTPDKLDPRIGTTLATARIAPTASGDWTTPPTVTARFGTSDVHPFNGYFWEPPQDGDVVIDGDNGSPYFGFELVTQGQAQTVDLEVYFTE